MSPFFKVSLSAIVIMLWSLAAVATPIELITDRPDFTESPDIVPISARFQIEGGFTMGFANWATDSTLGEVLVRIPLSTRWELRLGLNAMQFGPEGNGLQDATIGLKTRLWDAVDTLMIPSAALLVGTTIPTGTAGYKRMLLQPDIKLAANWDVSNTDSVAANVGYGLAATPDYRYRQFSWSVSWGHAWNDLVGSYLEYYRISPNDATGASQDVINGGVTYLVSPTFQVDARVGTGLNGIPNDWFWGVGMAMLVF